MKLRLTIKYLITVSRVNVKVSEMLQSVFVIRDTGVNTVKWICVRGSAGMEVIIYTSHIE